MIQLLTGQEINSLDYMLLSKLMNEQWHHGIGSVAIEQRLRTKNPFVVAEIPLRKKDERYVHNELKLRDYAFRTTIPACFLEGLFLEIEDYKELGQMNYNGITQHQGGIWKSPPENIKSLLLADLTSICSMWGVDISDEELSMKGNMDNFHAAFGEWITEYNPEKITIADIMIEYAVSKTRELGLKELWTYTPWKENYPYGINLHLRHDAIPTEHIIFDGRPNHIVNDVKIMDYRHRLV